LSFWQERRESIETRSERFSRDLEFKPAYESYPGEYLNYVKALAEENIFAKERTGQLLAKKFKTFAAALDMAIGLEKDSILFYNEMKKFVPESEHKPITEIISQEKEHFRKLLEIKRTQQRK